MKKLVALMLVFAVSSVASAALTLDVPATTMNFGATQAIGLSGDSGTPSPVALYLLVQGPASIAGGTIKYTGGLSALSDAEAIARELGETVPGMLAMVADLAAKPGLSDIMAITLADALIPPAALQGVLVSDITLTAGAEQGIAKLTLTSDDFAKTYASVDVNVVPEPITIALLGLGGLLLRRRR